MRVVFSVLLAFTLAGCAIDSTPLNYSSISGKPEIVLSNITLGEAKNQLIDQCVSTGTQIEEQGISSVICWKKLEGSASFFATLMVGNSYSTSPVQKSQFVFIQQGSDVKIVGTKTWIQSQMAFGQINQRDLTANRKPPTKQPKQPTRLFEDYSKISFALLTA